MEYNTVIIYSNPIITLCAIYGARIFKPVGTVLDPLCPWCIINNKLIEIPREIMI
jgi:hypothetical protein